MKVVFLAKYLNLSGVTTNMLTLTDYMEKKDHEVLVICGKDNEFDRDEIEKLLENKKVNINYVNFPNKRKNIVRELYHYVTSIPKSLYYIFKFKPDIIHVHWSVTGYIAKLSKVLFKIPTVTTFHALDIPTSILHQKTDYAIAISEAVKEDIHKRIGYKSECIELIYNGVKRTDFIRNEEDSFEIKKFYNISEEQTVISFVGTLNKNKGLDILLEALIEIRKRELDFKLIITGSGDSNWVKELVKRAELEENVIIQSFQNPYPVYNISDIFVLPSRNEAFGIVCVEAMLMEVSVIRTDTGGAQEQIKNGVDGFIFKSENISELVEILNITIKDKSFRREIGSNARKKAEKRFTQEVMAKKTLDLYEKIIYNKR